MYNAGVQLTVTGGGGGRGGMIPSLFAMGRHSSGTIQPLMDGATASRRYRLLWSHDTVHKFQNMHKTCSLHKFGTIC